MKINPLNDHVVVQYNEVEEKTKGGIILTNASKEKPQIATVIAVGPGKVEDGKTVPMPVKIGDKVLVNKYSGTEVKLEDEEYCIIRQNDILAIVE